MLPLMRDSEKENTVRYRRSIVMMRKQKVIIEEKVRIVGLNIRLKIEKEEPAKTI